MALFTKRTVSEGTQTTSERMLARVVACVSDRRVLFLASFFLILAFVPLLAYAEGTVENIGKSFVDGIVSGIGKVIAAILWVFVAAFGLLLRVAGLVLNWVVLVTVFQFSSYFGNSVGMLLAWTTLRDLANIILLFGFVWIGLQTILNVGHHFSVGKALPRLLIFAILINFSLFISEAVVDVSNVFTAVLYEQAGDVTCKTTATQVECINKGISGSVLGAIGFSSVLDTLSIGAKLPDPSTHGGQAAFSMLLMLILVVVLITVFLAMSIMLLTRSVVLIFLLVLSPLGFVGMAIPQFEEQAQKWWKMLISNSFFAPVLFLLLFVSLKIMEGAKATFGGGANFATAIMTPGANIGGAFILFGLMTGFLVFSLIAAKSMGAFGAEFATNTAGKVTGAMTFGAGAAVGRKFIGSWAYNQAEKMKAEGRHRTPEGMKQIARMEAMAKGSYDLRQAKIAGVDVGKKVAGFARIDFGEGKKGGYSGEIHEQEEAHKKFAESLKNTAEEKNIMGEIDAQIARKKTQDQRELNNLETTHDIESRPLRDALKERQREAADARATGDKAAIGLAELALRNAREDLTELTTTQDKAKKALEDGHKEWIAKQEAAKKELSEAPQRQYAHRLSTGPQVGILGDSGNKMLKTAYGMTTRSVAEHHAAEAILKNIKKDQNQKLIEALTGVQTSLKNQPAAGGGAAHAPAASGGAHHP